jgi:flagellin-like protein
MKNKKGISDIVATVLIILITVAAVAIVWAAIIPMIKDQLETGTLCMDAISQVQLESQGTCLNQTAATTWVTNVQLQRGSKEFNLVGVQALISAKGNSNAYVINTNVAGTQLTANGKRIYQVALPAAWTDRMNADEIQIAPIILIGTTNKTCDVSSKMNLRKC